MAECLHPQRPYLYGVLHLPYATSRFSQRGALFLSPSDLSKKSVSIFLRSLYILGNTPKANHSQIFDLLIILTIAQVKGEC